MSFFENNNSKQKEQTNIENNVTQELNTSLKVEVAELKTTIQLKDIEITSVKKKLSFLEQELAENENLDKKDLCEKISSLESQVKKLKFDIANNIDNIEMLTENAGVKADNKILQGEINHLNELLNVYRQMPDIKNMLDSLQKLSVPGIKELEAVANMMNEKAIKELIDKVNENTDAVRDLARNSFMRYGHR